MILHLLHSATLGRRSEEKFKLKCSNSKNQLNPCKLSHLFNRFICISSYQLLWLYTKITFQHQRTKCLFMLIKYFCLGAKCVAFSWYVNLIESSADFQCINESIIQSNEWTILFSTQFFASIEPNFQEGIALEWLLFEKKKFLLSSHWNAEYSNKLIISLRIYKDFKENSMG